MICFSQSSIDAPKKLSALLELIAVCKTGESMSSAIVLSKVAIIVGSSYLQISPFPCSFIVSLFETPNTIISITMQVSVYLLLACLIASMLRLRWSCSSTCA